MPVRMRDFRCFDNSKYPSEFSTDSTMRRRALLTSQPSRSAGFTVEGSRHSRQTPIHATSSASAAFLAPSSLGGGFCVRSEPSAMNFDIRQRSLARRSFALAFLCGMFTTFSAGSLAYRLLYSALQLSGRRLWGLFSRRGDWRFSIVAL